MFGKQRPRSHRVRTAIPAILIDSDGGEVQVEVIDLSSGGFRLRAEANVLQGETVRLRVPRYGDFSAQIQWVQDNEAGGRFLQPVTL